MSSNGRVILNEFERMRREAVVVCFELLSQRLSEETEENQESKGNQKPQFTAIKIEI
jgi:hypothetical protein